MRREYPDPFSSASIWAQPTLPEEEEKITVKLANDFLVGCDPEFCILNNGKVMNLAEYLPKDGEVGYDHGGLEAELRPKPAKGTYALLKRLRTLIMQNDKLNPTLSTYRWRSGAAVAIAENRNLTLGGHVHFGLLPRGLDPTDKDGAKFDTRIKALDRATKFMEALDILPRDESALRRDKGDRQNAAQQYGKWGDVRAAGADNKHIEYRTMASWLYDPKTAYLALTTAKLACAAPQLTLDTLKSNNYSFQNFVNFYEVFRHKDTNAKRALEKLLDNKAVKDVQGIPDVHFRDVWEKLPL
jgi:hypothetical protein